MSFRASIRNLFRRKKRNEDKKTTTLNSAGSNQSGTEGTYENPEGECQNLCESQEHIYEELKIEQFDDDLNEEEFPRPLPPLPEDAQEPVQCAVAKETEYAKLEKEGQVVSGSGLWLWKTDIVLTQQVIVHVSNNPIYYRIFRSQYTNSLYHIGDGRDLLILDPISNIKHMHKMFHVARFMISVGLYNVGVFFLGIIKSYDFYEEGLIFVLGVNEGVYMYTKKCFFKVGNNLEHFVKSKLQDVIMFPKGPVTDKFESIIEERIKQFRKREKKSVSNWIRDQENRFLDMMVYYPKDCVETIVADAQVREFFCKLHLAKRRDADENAFECNMLYLIKYISESLYIRSQSKKAWRDNDVSAEAQLFYKDLRLHLLIKISKRVQVDLEKLREVFDRVDKCHCETSKEEYMHLRHVLSRVEYLVLWCASHKKFACWEKSIIYQEVRDERLAYAKHSWIKLMRNKFNHLDLEAYSTLQHVTKKGTCLHVGLCTYRPGRGRTCGVQCNNWFIHILIFLILIYRRAEVRHHE